MADQGNSIEGAKLCGASACWFGKPLDSNPYPDGPGWYVLRSAWTWGWINSEAVLEAEATGNWQDVEAVRIDGRG
jgi:hypothetical protein